MMTQLEQAMLAALFDSSGEMSVTDLTRALQCTRRDLWQAVRSQVLLGNINRGPAIELSRSARVAIGAGRLTSTDWRAAA